MICKGDTFRRRSYGEFVRIQGWRNLGPDEQQVKHLNLSEMQVNLIS